MTDRSHNSDVGSRVNVIDLDNSRRVHSRLPVNARANFSADESHVAVNRRGKTAAGASPQNVTDPGNNSAASSQLVLSVFHGADIFGRGFEAEGFCVVRAGEIELGFDVRDLHLLRGRFDGVIAGTPCQQFSLANRTRSHIGGGRCDCYGCEMLKEFARLVLEAQPAWFVLENVPQVPDIEIDGYSVQRFDLSARECGLKQFRRRHFQFGSRAGQIIIVDRQSPETDLKPSPKASEGKHGKKRPFVEFAALQGMPPGFDLPYLSLGKKYEAIGNAVPLAMGRAIARAVRDIPDAAFARSVTLCICRCGRIVTDENKRGKTHATDNCRKRMQIRRERAQLNPAG